MKKYLILIYAVICYLIGLVVTLWYMDFWAERWLPNSLNNNPPLPWLQAVMTDVFLISIFGLQHSIMPRRWFKSAIKSVVPQAAERSTYVLFSSLALVLICLFWEPMAFELYNLKTTGFSVVFWAGYLFGWFLVFLSSFQIDHLEMFGIKQAWINAKQRQFPGYTFKIPFLYRLVRHPLYLGWLIVHWFTPHLTLDRLLLAIGMTIYTFIGIIYEEKDLVQSFGENYRKYQKKTPKIIPGLKVSKQRTFKQE